MLHVARIIDSPGNNAGAEPVHHLYVVRAEDRDALRKYLGEQDIATGVHYPVPLHLQPAYRHLGYKPGDFPVSERIARECLSLPLFPEMTDEQQDWVVAALAAAVTNGGRR